MKFKGLILTVLLLGSVAAEAQLLGGVSAGVRGMNAIRSVRMVDTSNDFFKATQRVGESFKATISTERSYNQAIYLKESGIVRRMVRGQDNLIHSSFVIPARSGSKVVSVENMHSIRRINTMFGREFGASETYQVRNMWGDNVRVKTFEYGTVDPMKSLKDLYQYTAKLTGARKMKIVVDKHNFEFTLPDNIPGNIFHYDLKWVRGERLPRLTLFTWTRGTGSQIEVPLQVAHDNTTYVDFARKSLTPLTKTQMMEAIAEVRSVPLRGTPRSSNAPLIKISRAQ